MGNSVRFLLQIHSRCYEPEIIFFHLNLLLSHVFTNYCQRFFCTQCTNISTAVSFVIQNCYSMMHSALSLKQFSTVKSQTVTTVCSYGFTCSGATVIMCHVKSVLSFEIRRNVTNFVFKSTTFKIFSTLAFCKHSIHWKMSWATLSLMTCRPVTFTTLCMCPCKRTFSVVCNICNYKKFRSEFGHKLTLLHSSNTADCIISMDVCLSDCLSVCSSHADIVSKRPNLWLSW